jgi:DNA end-binding protein Ku
VTKEELENVALESTRTIEIDEFVDRSQIDQRYLIRPYGRKGRPRRLRGHPPDHPRDEQGRDRARGAGTNREHISGRYPDEEILAKR